MDFLIFAAMFSIGLFCYGLGYRSGYKAAGGRSIDDRVRDMRL